MLTLQRIHELSGQSGEYFNRIPITAIDYYLSIEERVMNSSRGAVIDAFASYVDLAQLMFIRYAEDNEFWGEDNASMNYILVDVANRMIAQDADGNIIPYVLEDDEYREFLIHTAKVFPESDMRLTVSDCTLAAVQNLHTFLTSHYTSPTKRTVIDFLVSSPNGDVEPKLYSIALTATNLRRLLVPGPMTFWLDENSAGMPNKHYGLIMSELDLELFKVYMWTGLVGKPKYHELNDELKKFVDRFGNRIEEAKIAPVEFKHLNGARYEPFQHDKAALRDYLENHIPAF